MPSRSFIKTVVTGVLAADIPTCPDVCVLQTVRAVTEFHGRACLLLQPAHLSLPMRQQNHNTPTCPHTHTPLAGRPWFDNVALRGAGGATWFAQLRLLFSYKDKPFALIRYYDECAPLADDTLSSQHGCVRLTWASQHGTPRGTPYFAVRAAGWAGCSEQIQSAPQVGVAWGGRAGWAERGVRAGCEVVCSGRGALAASQWEGGRCPAFLKALPDHDHDHVRLWHGRR